MDSITCSLSQDQLNHLLRVVHDLKQSTLFFDCEPEQFYFCFMVAMVVEAIANCPTHKIIASFDQVPPILKALYAELKDAIDITYDTQH